MYKFIKEGFKKYIKGLKKEGKQLIFANHLISLRVKNVRNDIPQFYATSGSDSLLSNNKKNISRDYRVSFKDSMFDVRN